MAGDNKIKISADTSAIKKSLLDLSKEVKDLGKSKVSIFDKSQKDFLSKEAKKHMKDIQGQIDKNNKSIIATTKLLNQEGRTLQQNLKTRQRLTNMMKKQVELQKDLGKLNTMSTNLGGGGGKGILGKLGGLFGKGGGGSMMGLGGMARFLGPMGLALGAGGFAVSRAMKANNTFRGGIGDRMSLRGRGVTDMNLQDKEGAAEVGLNAQSMRRARLASMDVFGETGSTQQAVMQRAAFERNFGLERGTIAQAGEGVRSSLGGAGAEKAMMTMQASLIASGITDEIGPYLETAAGMLTTINEKGITFNDSAMGLLADLASKDGVAAERAGRLSTGIDAAIRGSTGESNAFFQQVFSKAGIGGGSLGGIQAAMRSGGLFGANTDADALLSDKDKAMFKRTGIGGNNMKRVAGQTLNTLDELFGTDEQNSKLSQEQQDNKRLQRLDFVRRTFGLQSEVEAGNVEQLLKSARDGSKSEAEVKKELNKIQSGNTELGNLQSINKTAAAQTQILKDIHESILDEAGEDLAPIFNTMDKTMMKLDATLTSLMNFFGIESPDSVVDQGMKGQDVIDKDSFDAMTGGDKKKAAKMKQELDDQIKAKEKELQDLGPAQAYSHRYGIGDPNFHKREKLKGELGNLKESQENIGAPIRLDPNMGTGAYLQRPGNTPQLGRSGDVAKDIGDIMSQFMPNNAKTPNTDNPLVPLMRENLEIQRRSAKANEETAKNSKRKGSAPNTTPRDY